MWGVGESRAISAFGLIEGFSEVHGGLTWRLMGAYRRRVRSSATMVISSYIHFGGHL